MGKCKKVVLITGASSGFGYDLAIKLAKRGCTVHATARSADKLKTLRKYGVIDMPMDVQDDENVKNVVREILRKNGRIDVAYLNAGYGEYGAIETVATEDVTKQFDVNVVGVHRVLREVLPSMRKRRKGRIVITTSIVAHISVPFGGWYASSKFALEGMAEALRMEVSDLGIKVITIEPGPVKTNFVDVSNARLDSDMGNDDYQEKREKYYDFLDDKNAKAPNTDSTVLCMVHAGMSKNPKDAYLSTPGAKAVYVLRALLGRKLYYKATKKVLFR